MFGKILDFFKNKKVGFYLTLAGAILLYVISLVYTTTFRNIVHATISYSYLLSLIPLITFFVVCALLIFDESAPFAPAPLLVGQFITFLLVINDSYLYLSDYFFEMSTFSDFLNALKEVDKGYIATLILIFVVFIIGTVALFFKVVDAPLTNKLRENKKVKVPLIIAKVLSYLMVMVFGLCMIGGQIALDNSSAINSQFNIETQKKIDTGDGSENPDKYVYYKSAFTNFTDVLNSGKEIARETVAEGAVLLKNENHTLPFAPGTGVTLFGSTSVFPALSGTGSGAWVDSVAAGSTLFKDGFEQAGLQINEKVFNFYKKNTALCRIQSGTGTTIEFTIGDVKWGDSKWNEIVTGGVDARLDPNYRNAIFIIARQGGEGKDFKMTTGDKSDMTDGNYLTLSPNELDMLRNLKAQKAAGKFDSITVIINSAYQVCGFTEDFGIDAVLWSGSIGSFGTYAIGDILAGKVNPSGRLSDTFWTDHSKNPANFNFGNFTYSDRKNTQNTMSKYVVYQEGVYMGYRYAETRYEDKVIGTENVGNFDYYDTVEYPFGYGLSYTNFEYSNFQCAYDSATDSYNMSVKVTNTGTVAGKEPVQIYLSKPYTIYDKANHIEKPSVELVTYDKTDEILPGGSQTLTFSVARRELASYDAYNKKTYILEGGNYVFTAAKDSHEAVNNVIVAKGFDANKIVTKGNSGAGNSSLAKIVKIDGDDFKSYSKSLNGTKITNAFDTADIKIFEPGSVNETAFQWTTRSNWADTVATKAVALKRTDKMDECYLASQGADLKPDVEAKEKPTYGADNGLQLIDLRAYSDEDDDPTNDEWVPFDDPLWDQFLDQLTWDESVRLLSDGLRHTLGIDRLGKPETLEHNGGVGFKNYTACQTGIRLATSADLKNYRQKIINYPCNGISASTFNNKLMYKMGVQWGEDALWTGHNVLYGPGNNLHRSAYNGRNFEYYSEDPVLTGYASRYLDEGMATKGAVAYLKHCVLNDQETNRQYCVNTWCTEQAIREVYLKAFQIPIENGPLTGVMTAFNGIGPVWSSSQGFCKQVLHGEFGMLGVAVSDFIKDYMYLPVAVTKGGDLPDGQRVETQLDAFKEGYTEVEWAMRQSLHYIMYQTVHTNVMNGTSSTSKLVKITPLWMSLVSVARIVSGVLLVGSVGFLASQVVMGYHQKPLGRKDEKEAA